MPLLKLETPLGELPRQARALVYSSVQCTLYMNRNLYIDIMLLCYC